MTDRGTGRRVVVTGAGAIASLGQNATELWANMKAGRSGIGPIGPVMPEHLRQNLRIGIAAQIPGFDHKARLKHIKRDKVLLHTERYSWLAAVAADEAIRQSGIEVPFVDAPRVGCFVGSAAGGQITVETASRDHYLSRMKATHPLVLVRIIASSAAAHLGIEYGAKGPVFATSSACASAHHSIGLGCHYIRSGLIDVAIVGGSESAITSGIMMALQSLQVLSPDGCRPFARNRNGTVLGEGAGVLILESEAHARARGARMLAEIAGFGMTASGDLVKPEVEGPSEAMRQALVDARLDGASIDYINAFGSGTIQSDCNETKVIKAALGAHAHKVAISSTKSMHGWTTGASGGIEAIACLKAIEEGFVPPTIGLDEPDPACDLDYVANVGRARRVSYAMSSSFAVGGFNACVIYGPPPA